MFCWHPLPNIGIFSSAPSMGKIFGMLPDRALKSRRINIGLEAIVPTTTANFSYAPSCFLDAKGTKTEELQIKVNRMHCAGDQTSEFMWYHIMKMPKELSVFVAGELGSSDKRVDEHVYRYLLKNGKPHPARPSTAAFSAITESRRVIAAVRPIIEATYQEQVLIRTDRSGKDSDSHLCSKLGNVLRWIEK
ncbi:hypothetical protein DOTSEDRAFT_25747 [Dothistroma septosporum NZE10]|uniref:Uncharacterized protein n=1 Tax=Dothistroma septosporum (strain NZE10 / CBS 128990) TaxID=675120 RepID=N1PI87_DOTSN|nr:hypothetical protein DOTSEDRAFT_25747 [Dothistroma septosporum NZE10]